MKRILAILSVISTSLSGCHDGRNDCILSCVPRPVINPPPINMSSIESFNLESKGWTYLDGPGAGNGLIVLKVRDREYKVYDRNPPDLCPGEGTRLKIERGIVVCPKNQGQWSLYTGAPEKGASCPLIEYRVWHNPIRDEIYITNW